MEYLEMFVSVTEHVSRKAGNIRGFKGTLQNIK